MKIVKEINDRVWNYSVKVFALLHYFISEACYKPTSLKLGNFYFSIL